MRLPASRPQAKASTLTRVELVERDAELAQAGKELGLDLPVDRVVDALVRRRLDVPVLAADVHDLRDLPCHVVRDTEPLELALLVQLAHRLERVREGRCAVRAVQVPHVDRAVLGVRLERTVERVEIESGRTRSGETSGRSRGGFASPVWIWAHICTSNSQ